MAASSPKWNNHSGEENVIVPQPLEVMEPKAKNKRRHNLFPNMICHQCRQKANDFVGACKNYRKKGRKGPCPIRYCGRCLLNRYGEAEDAKREDWICPKCRDICNCSCCRNKKGEMPTGALTHIARATGFTSVHDLLQEGPEAVAAAQALSSSAKRGQKRVEEISALANEFQDEGHGNMGTNFNQIPFVPTKKRTKRYRILNNNFIDGRPPLLSDESPDAIDSSIVQPNGSQVANIAGAQLADIDGSIRAFIQEFKTKENVESMLGKSQAQASRTTTNTKSSQPTKFKSKSSKPTFIPSTGKAISCKLTSA